METLKIYVHAMRLDRWPRSMSILTGTATALFLSDIKVNPYKTPLVIAVTLIATFAVAVFNYIINEITDAPFDRHHPLKKHRPVPSGRIGTFRLLLIGLILLLGGLILGSRVSFYTLINLCLLALAGIIYNVPPVRTKDIPYLDAIVESANNPIRFNIGWYAIQPAVHPPFTILISWWAFGAFLMYAKRLSEKRYLTAEQASLYRRSLATYTQRGLGTTIFISALTTIGSLSFFAYFHNYPRLWLSILLLIPYFLWIVHETLNRSGRVEEPEALFRRPAFIILTMLLLLSLLWGVGKPA